MIEGKKGEFSLEGKRIRVLIIAYACEPNRGSEPGTGWNVATGLAKYCDVTVVTRANNEEVIEKALAENDFGNISFVYEDPDKILLRLKKAKILPVQAFYAFWQLAVAKRITKDRLFEQCDIAHHMTFNSFEIPAYALLNKSKAKYVWGPIGGGQRVPLNHLSLFGFKNGIKEYARSIRVKLFSLNPWSVRVLRNSDLVYFANEETRELLEHQCKGDVRMMIDVGVDCEKFKPRCASSDASPIPIILFGGRLEGRKGGLLLLKALAKLKRDGEKFECRIVGSGPDEGKLKRYIRENDLGSEVSMLGLVTHDQMAKEFSEADLFVFSSLRDTSGAIVMEAMATSLPSVCIDHQGGGIILDETCGIKVPPASVQEMVDGMRAGISSLLNDASLRERMGKAGRKRVMQEYDWKERVKRVLAGYESVLKMNRKS